MNAFDLLVPQPVSVEPTDGVFVLDETLTVDADDDTAIAADRFVQRLRDATGLRARQSANGTMTFRVDRNLKPEGYRIEIGRDSVLVKAADPRGAAHATQTLRQLLGPDGFRRSNIHSGQWVLPCGIVTDHPRFGWRGCLLDVARHFLPKADVLRFVDLLAAHKLNVLHLHLTDDQGWRIEVPGLPRLTEISSWRTDTMIGHPPHGRLDGRPHGGYYRTEDLREIVRYAADLGITVVPEIDVPGHTQAAIAAYPELGNTGEPLPVWTSWGVNENVLNVADRTVAMFGDIFDHVADVFDSEVIAVGGDEVPTVQWERSAEARRKAAELRLRDVAGLHGWFIGQLARRLAARGRRILGWDEITEVGGMPPGTIVASWRGEDAGVLAARAGYDVVMCPEQWVYLDHRQSTDPDEPIPVGHPRGVDDVYRYEPVPAGLDGTADAERVLGAQAQVWTEHLDSARRIDYAAFPRLAAFAEVVWSPRDRRELPDFQRRLRTAHLARLDALGVEYRPLDGPKPWQRRPGVPGRPLSE